MIRFNFLAYSNEDFRLPPVFGLPKYLPAPRQRVLYLIRHRFLLIEKPDQLRQLPWVTAPVALHGFIKTK
jgi:hypothetical protein